jgi:hypothetical protein
MEESAVCPAAWLLATSSFFLLALRLVRMAKIVDDAVHGLPPALMTATDQSRNPSLHFVIPSRPQAGEESAVCLPSTLAVIEDSNPTWEDLTAGWGGPAVMRVSSEAVNNPNLDFVIPKRR